MFEKQDERPYYLCYSKDVKETYGIHEGAICLEIDTGIEFWFYDNKWHRKIPGFVGNVDYFLIQGELGNVYTFSHVQHGIVDQGYFVFHVKASPLARMMFSSTMAVTGKASLETFYNSQYSNEGTPHFIYPRNTMSTKQAKGQAFLNPVVSVLGEQRVDDLFTGTTGPQKTGGAISGAITILGPGDDLYYRIKNLDGQGKVLDVSINLNFIELDENTLV